MANVVYVIPGILGSEIIGPGAISGRELYWLPKGYVAKSRVFNLLLNQAGNAQSNPNTAPTEAVDLFPGYYDQLVTQLRKSWSVTEWATDWRYSVHDLADELVAEIKRVGPGFDVYLVGHSQGGLVALETWKRLNAQGLGGQVKRIVTLGAPFRGSWAAVTFFGRLEYDYVFLAAAAISAAYLLGKVSSPLAFAAAKKFTGLPIPTTLDQLICSWPGYFELLPNPQSQIRPGQLPAADLFITNIMTRCMTSIPLYRLNTASTVIVNRLGGALPAAPLVVNVAAVGSPTPEYLKTGYEINDPAGYHQSDDGDGRVMLSSATLYPASLVKIVGPHADMPRHSHVLDNIDDWLTNGVVTGPLGPINGIPGKDAAPTTPTVRLPTTNLAGKSPPVGQSGSGNNPRAAPRPAFCP